MAAQSADFAGEIAELKRVLLGTESVGDFLLDLAVLAVRELLAEHVRIDDLVFDQRWWEYAVRALARGVRSSLSIPVSAQGDPVGSINLYSDRPRFFDDAQTRRAEQFAAEATDAVGHAAQLKIRQRSRASDP